MIKDSPLYSTATLLVIIGGINWGLIGTFEFNVISYLFYEVIYFPIAAKIFYILVGIAALFMIYGKSTCYEDSKYCKK